MSSFQFGYIQLLRPPRQAFVAISGDDFSWSFRCHCAAARTASRIVKRPAVDTVAANNAAAARRPAKADVRGSANDFRFGSRSEIVAHKPVAISARFV